MYAAVRAPYPERLSDTANFLLPLFGEGAAGYLEDSVHQSYMWFIINTPGYQASANPGQLLL